MKQGIEKTKLPGAVWSLFLFRYYLGDQIKKTEMAGMWHTGETGELQS